jgi:hypothetical protein
VHTQGVCRALERRPGVEPGCQCLDQPRAMDAIGLEQRRELEGEQFGDLAVGIEQV